MNYYQFKFDNKPMFVILNTAKLTSMNCFNDIKMKLNVKRMY